MCPGPPSKRPPESTRLRSAGSSTKSRPLTTPPPTPTEPPPGARRHRLSRRRRATGHDRYTERLAGTDLSRVLYVYGNEDMIVGRLTDDEVGFLTSSGSRVLAVQAATATLRTCSALT